MTELEFEELEIKAQEIIIKYFFDKKDAGGNYYLEHLYTVANSIEYNDVNEQGQSIMFYKKAYIVALLHDILEDTDCTIQKLKHIGCDDEIIEAIKSVTRNKNEYYFDFIERASKNKIGRLVKIYDLENNMDIRRLTKFGDYEQKRLKKYWYSWKFLKKEITIEEAINGIHPKGYK